MTAPPSQLRALDDGHRAKQAANAVAVQQLVQRLFVQMVDPKNIAGTAQPWLREVVVAIMQGRQTAITLATGYAMAIRRLQAPDAPPFAIPRPDDPPVAKLIRSLTYTGPGKLAVDLAKTPEPIEPDVGAPRVDIEEYDRGVKQFQAAVKERSRAAAVMSSAAAYRHVSTAAHDLIDSAIQHDPVATGYLRITKGQPCAFCLMLASRGPVYKEDSFAQSDPRFTGPGNHKVHDGCGCMLRPLYGSRSAANWTDEARRAEKLWIDKAAGFSGRNAINAFARAARDAGIADLNRWGQATL